MATTYTSKLNILKVNPDDQFADEAFNKTLDDIDNKVVGISHLTSAMHWQEWKASTAYAVGDVVRYVALKGGQYAKCTVAGTSSTTTPTNNVTGSIVSDGTVSWEVCSLADLLSSSILHNDLKGRALNDAHPISAITGLQTALDAKATPADITTAVTNLINGAPATLDTLKEIADWIANDEVQLTSILSTLANKVDKVTGKGLSTNDYTNIDKAKVDNISVTKAVNLDTISDNSHTHSNKTDLDKIGEDTNGNFTYNGKTITGGIKEWTANTPYITGQLLYHGNITYRVTANFTSGTSFTDSNLKEVIIGYLDDWKPSTYYNVDQCVYNAKSILRCTTAHTSGTSYDTNEANNWEIIATSGAVVNTWKPSTLYTANEMVIYNDTMYFANVTHTSSSTFESDMGVGNEKWRTANASSVLGEWKQVTKLNATANTVVTIIINNTYTFIAPPVEILKFVAGTANVTVNELDFDNNDATKFSIGGSPASDSFFVEFGNNKDTTKTSTGTMHLLSDIKVVQDSVETMTIDNINYGYVCKFKPIDFSSDFKSISSWEVLSNG